MRQKVLTILFVLFGTMMISSELSKKYQADWICEINEFMIDYIKQNKSYPSEGEFVARFPNAEYMKSENEIRVRIPYGIFDQYSFWVVTSKGQISYGTY